MSKSMNIEKSIFDVAGYWEKRYQSGRGSGAGSYSRLAKFKSEFINDFISRHSVNSAIELGCGDGAQLGLIDYPTYIGLDISNTTVENCAKKFEADDTKSFYHYIPHTFDPSSLSKSDLALSLDVIYHLSNDEVYDLYLEHLFSLSNKFVVIYSNSQTLYMKGVNEDAEYVRFRKFEQDIKERFPEWSLVKIEPNFYPFNPSLPNDSSFADFYVFKKDADKAHIVEELDNSYTSFLLKKIVQKQMVSDEQVDMLNADLKNLTISMKSLPSKADIERVLEKFENLEKYKGQGQFGNGDSLKKKKNCEKDNTSSSHKKDNPNKLGLNFNSPEYFKG